MLAQPDASIPSIAGELDEHRLTITVDRAFGRGGPARIIGCLEGLNLDLVLADVLTFDSVPAPAPHPAPHPAPEG